MTTDVLSDHILVHLGTGPTTLVVLCGLLADRANETEIDAALRGLIADGRVFELETSINGGPGRRRYCLKPKDDRR